MCRGQLLAAALFYLFVPLASTALCDETGLQAVVIDVEDVQHTLTDVHVIMMEPGLMGSSEKRVGYLPVRSGAAEIEVNLAVLARLDVQIDGDVVRVILTNHEGDTLEAEIDGSLKIAGRVEFGDIQVEFVDVKRVLFLED